MLSILLAPLTRLRSLICFATVFPSADPDEVTQLTEILDNCSSEIGGADNLQSSEFQRHFLRYFKSSKDALMNLHLVRDYLLIESQGAPSSKTPYVPKTIERIRGENRPLKFEEF